ncbi:MAG: chloride channel protein [Gammaproteobacteria bacterium]|nr:chloride channel protein [Gammaproteobacteria bacterium]
MSGGPSKETKIGSAISDTSHLLAESWVEIIRNFLIVSLIGSMVWFFCSVLRFTIEHSTDFLFEQFHHHAHHIWSTGSLILIAALIVSGVVRGWMLKYDYWQDAAGDGAATSIEYFHKTYTGHHDDSIVDVRYKQSTVGAAVRRVIITFLTVGFGGSGGIEGPVIPIGEHIGAGWSKLFRVKNRHDLRVFQMAGIAAAISTLLNAPFAAALFAGEVVFAERLVYRTLLYSMIAAICAYTLNNHLLHFQPLFSIAAHAHVYAPREYLEVSLVAILCSAPAALGINSVLMLLRKFMTLFNVTIRALIGAFFIGAIAFIMWFGLHIAPEHILGVSEGTLQTLINGSNQALFNIWWILFLLAFAKLLTMGFTYAAGGSVGLLIPAMYIGGVIGAAIYHVMPLLHIPVFSMNPSLFIIAGIASALVAVIEIPLATIAFVMEVFGAKFAAPAIVSVVICHLLAKRFKLYVAPPRQRR